MDSIFDTYLIMNIKKYDKEEKETENYKRFNNKKIITCIFTLDRSEPYYIDWYNNNDNLIKINNDLITQNIYESILKQYKSYNNDIYYIYKKSIIDSPSKNPIKIIEYFKDKIEKMEEKKDYIEFPNYIYRFIDSILFELNKSDNKKNIINSYKNEEYFIAQIDKILDKSIKKFLGLNNDDDDLSEISLDENEEW
jgi:hypothetical protein